MDFGWTPAAQLALVNALAQKPGASLESFFSAHGLASDYVAAGKYAGRLARINSALRAAEKQDNLPTILQAASEFFEIRVWPSVRPNEYQKEVSMTNDRGGLVFISHAAYDKKLASLLKDTLLLGGVGAERVFYSSERATGIPSGVGIRQHLQETLRDSSLVIEIITETFLTRPYCLMELGAAWVTEKPTYPIVVPPLTRDEVVRKIGEVQLGVLGGGADVDELMDELHDGIEKHLGISLTARSWGDAVRKFKTSFPDLLSEGANEVPQTFEPKSSGSAEAYPAGVEAELHGLSLRNSTVISGRYSTEVHGEVVNNTTASRTATIKATFYCQSKIIGTAIGVANDVGPGNMNTFTLTSMDPIGEYDRYSIQFDGVF